MNEEFNHRLTGAVSSNESVMQVRLMMRTSRVSRVQPGIREFEGDWFIDSPPARKYYKRADWHSDLTYYYSDGIGSSSHWNQWDGWFSIQITNPGGFEVNSTDEGQGGADGDGYTSNWYETKTGGERTPYARWDATTEIFGTDDYSTTEDWWNDQSGTTQHEFLSAASGWLSVPYTTSTNSDVPLLEMEYADLANESESYSWWTSEKWTPPGGAPHVESGIEARLTMGSDPWIGGTPTGPTTSADGYTGDLETWGYSLDLSEEYTALDFLNDTVALLPPYMLVRGTRSSWSGTRDSEATFEIYDQFPRRVEGSSFSLDQANSGNCITSQSYWSADLMSIDLTKSEWWLECNDCLPAQAVVVEELEQNYNSDTWLEDGPPSVVTVESIKPGSHPGSVVKSVVHHSDVTGSGANRKVRYIGTSPLEFVALNSAGDPTGEPIGLKTSMPSPVVDFQCSVSNISRNSSGQIVGTVTVTGTVTSELCDTMPAPDGQIDQAELYVNGSSTPVAVVPLTVSKTQANSFGKPYPYLGTANATINNVPLTEGVNVLRFSAFDKVYENPGYCEWSAEIQSAFIPQGQTAIVSNSSGSLNLANATTTSNGRLQNTVSYATSGGSAQSITVTETFAGSGILEGAAGNGVTISVAGISTSATARRTLAITLTDTLHALANIQWVLSESAVGSGAFLGNLGFLADANGQAIQPPPSDPDDGTVGSEMLVLNRLTLVGQSTGGEFHPFVVRVRGSDSWVGKLQVSLGGGTLTSNLITSTNPGDLYMERPGTNKPYIFTIKPCKATPDDVNDNLALATLNEIFSSNTIPDAGRFLKGFARGLGAGGYSMVADTVHLVAGGVKYLGNGLLMLGCTVRIGVNAAVGADSNTEWTYIQELTNENSGVNDAATQLAQFLWETAKLVQGNQDLQMQVIIGLLTGDDTMFSEAMLQLSEMHRTMFSFAAELLKEQWKTFSLAKPEEQGYILGRTAFEVVSLLFTPEFKGTNLAKLSKLEFLQKLKLRPFFQSGGKGAAAMETLAPYVEKLATTKMCFVAGTKVWTKSGLKNIEEVKAGDEVMARSELTGEQGLKPVMGTVVTHPASLVHVRFSAQSRHAGEGESGATEDEHSSRASEEELICTPQHPFYVRNRAEGAGFVEAGSLESGNRLRLVDGSDVVVTRLQSEVSPAGEFTTYNFEVADFHTYFVGASGVWAHNSAKTPCERAFSIFERFRERESGLIWGPFKKTIAKLDRVDSPEILNQKVFNEARKKFFEEGISEAPLWLNEQGIVQNLKYADDNITPIADSSRLAENLEKVLGYKKIPNSQAHHIIPKADFQAQELRDMLRRFRIHPDDASNGTFMISTRTRNEFGANSEWLDGLGPNHQNHPANSAYIIQLKQDLARFKTLEATPENAVALKNELQKVAKKLIDNKYPWP